MDDNTIRNPFEIAWDFIQNNPGDEAEALAKLTLSLFDYYSFSYPLPDAFNPLHPTRRTIAVNMTAYYFAHGMNEATKNIARAMLPTFSYLQTKSKRKKKQAEDEYLAELIWKAKRAIRSLETAVANQDWDHAHSQSGRVADIIHQMQKDYGKPVA